MHVEREEETGAARSLDCIDLSSYSASLGSAGHLAQMARLESPAWLADRRRAAIAAETIQLDHYTLDPTSAIGHTCHRRCRHPMTGAAFVG
jgi:hypothetical protein